jgi:hypothetical protein
MPRLHTEAASTWESSPAACRNTHEATIAAMMRYVIHGVRTVGFSSLRGNTGRWVCTIRTVAAGDKLTMVRRGYR